MPATSTVCSSPSESLDALVSICAWAEDLFLAYAWVTSGNGQAAHWRALPLDKIRRAIIGIQFAQTEPRALRSLVALGGEVTRVIDDTGGVFHPKLIIGRKGHGLRALIGSSNLTSGGFSGNTELNLLLEGTIDEEPLKDFLTFVETQWTHPRAFVPDEDWLVRYEGAYAKRPAPKPVRVPPEKIVINSADDLDIDWSDYFRLIEQQERRMLSSGAQIHVFDHEEASYLQEIEQCQQLVARHPVFAKMPLDERKFVAGFGGSSGYFGRMAGAGSFMNMVIERPEEVGPLIDAIPLTGPVTEAQARKYLAGAMAIYRVKLGAATRLLIAKRPDLFLPVNGASVDRIKRVFGSAPRSAAQYIALMDRIWAMPWFNSDQPTDAHQLRVWRVRVAILDAVMYERKVGTGPRPFSEASQ